MPTTKRRKQTPRSQAKNAYELLSEICVIILAEPKRYDQYCWLDVAGEHDKQPDCGTVGCIAGWTVVLKAKRLPKSLIGIQERAGRILGLDSYQQTELFDGSAAGDLDDTQTRAHARGGVRHIREFQSFYKEQLLKKKV